MYGQTVAKLGDHSLSVTNTTVFATGGRSLDIRLTTADLVSVHDKVVREDMSNGVLVTVFEPDTGLFWWSHQGTRANHDLHVQAVRFTEAPSLR